MSEDKLHRATVRGAHAAELLRSELVQEAFAQLEADYIAAWRVTPARDTDARERLYVAVNVIGKVKEHLGHVAAGGRLAQAEIDSLVRAQEQREKK